MNQKLILQVEDDPADVFLYRRAFQDAGISNPLQVATDGQMAIDYLSGTGAYADRQQHPLPCLVLLDLKLPKKSGLEVLCWIRSQPGLKRIAVIILSSSSLELDIIRAIESGANSYVEKSVDYRESCEFARMLKGWWFHCNRFPPLESASRQ